MPPLKFPNNDWASFCAAMRLIEAMTERAKSRNASLADLALVPI